MIPAREKLKNTLHIRVSDSFLQNIEIVKQILIEKYGEKGITPSDVIRRLATWSFILMYGGYSLYDLIKLLETNTFIKCRCGYTGFSKDERCPKCGKKARVMECSLCSALSSNEIKKLQNVKITDMINILLENHVNNTSY